MVQSAQAQWRHWRWGMRPWPFPNKGQRHTRRQQTNSIYSFSPGLVLSSSYILCNPLNCAKQVKWFLFYRWKNWGMAGLNKLHKVTQLVAGRSGIKLEQLAFGSPVFSLCYSLYTIWVRRTLVIWEYHINHQLHCLTDFPRNCFALELGCMLISLL